MKKELRDRWVEALRNGQYEQAHGTLRGCDNYYCCLGVLSEVASQKNWDGVRYTTINGQETVFDDSEIPLQNLKNIGLDEHKSNVLMCMNDGIPMPQFYTGPQKSFSEIADWIEENIEVEI